MENGIKGSLIISKQFILQGLNCAGCAAKIEEKVNSLEEVEEAILNFSTSTLVVRVRQEQTLEIIEDKVKTIVNNFEPDVLVKEKIKNSDRIVRDGNHQEHSHEHREGTSRKNIIKVIIGTIIFSIAFLFQFSFYIEVSMYFLSYLFIGGDIILRALRNIGRGQVFDENFLMFIATIGAFIIGEFPEAVFVMLFYKVGEAFQDKAVNHSRKSIASLMNIRPEVARVKYGDDFNEVHPEEVNIGETIVVKPGEKIPLDGVIVEGDSMVNTSDLTGESVPRKVEKGNEVLSGFINETGLLTIEVTKVFSESAVSKILDLVENAGSKKAPTEQFITKFAKYYTPVVVFSALGLALLPPILLPNASFLEWIKRSLIFLVVSCPCALVISVPLGFFAGIGTASKNGILVKGGNYLEALNSINTIVFDKTGTLTKGVFNVTEVNVVEGITKEELVQYAAYGEVYSNHPIGRSILRHYGKEIDKEFLKDYKDIPGYGIEVKIKDEQIIVGNRKLMDKHNVNVEECNFPGTIVYVAVNNKFLGYLIISDELKTDSVVAVNKLKGVGIQNIVMLTGDNKLVGEFIARELKVDKVYSELLPQDKVEIFEKLKRKNKGNGKIAFVGDGVNDAPVLTRADVGIAMGALGSDAAIEAADVVLMTDEPSKLVTAIGISKFTRKIVMQNIVFALSVKFIVLLLGAFGKANMWQAVFADVGVALLAVINSMRVLRFKE